MRSLFRRSGQHRARRPVTDYLRQVDLFKDMPTDQLEVLFKGVMLRECTPGTVFFTPDDPGERLFALKEGHVELYRLTPDGKRLVTRHIGPGTVFGEMGLLGQSMQGCFAEASESSLVCVATRDDVLRVIRERTDVVLRLLEALGNRIRLLEEQLEQAAFSPVRVRLASFLLANADPATGVFAGHTQADIGDSIGAMRQTVSEALSEMQREGLIQVDHRSIRIINREALEAGAQE